MKNTLLSPILILLLSYGAWSQQAGQRLNIPVQRADGSAYLHPDIGGMNNPQFSEIDLNRDGTMDLVVFDRTGNVILPFINGGTPNTVDYTYAPEYAKAFPETLAYWCILRDYDMDGIMDIFSYSSTPGIAGVDTYKGSVDDDGNWQFDLVRNWHNDFDLLSFPGFSGLELEIYVSQDDIPSIADIDNDGDLDLLTFGQFGSKVEWYKNLSQEMGYGSDSLYFELHDDCWGLFLESGISSDIQLSNSPNECADLNFRRSPRHVGSTTACWDNDGDGDYEMLIGDITSQSIAYVNSSTTSNNGNPWMDMVDNQFPSYDTSVDIGIFPAPFVLDLNNDGRKDVVCAPNDPGQSANLHVAWRYENYTDSGEGLFNFREDDFLVGDGLDFGQGSKPTFFDYNGDGLLDIIVGTDGYFSSVGQFDTRLIVLENIGTVDAPSYRIADEDWLGFSQYNDRNLAPAFGDLDGDGDEDLLVGQNNGQLFFVENIGTVDNPSFGNVIPEYQGIAGGQKCVPAIADLNGDGLGDIITGVRQGWVGYFENVGTVGNPSFIADINTAPNIMGLGQIDVRDNSNGFVDTRGYASPKVFELADGSLKLISGSYFNQIFIYDAAMGNTTEAYPLEAQDYGDITQGQQTALDMADIDNDGYYEMVVGNQRGGLAFYQTNYIASSVSNPKVHHTQHTYSLHPNPAQHFVSIQFPNSTTQPTDVKMGLMDIQGRWLQNMHSSRKLSLAHYPKGVYIVVVDIDGERSMEQLIK